MIIVYTDPHLGLQRAAHTTPESKKRLQDAQFKTVSDIHARKGPGDMLVCAGDFFDTYSNSEEVIARSAPLLSQVDICLSGNHDVVGRESKMGSLELLDSVLPRDGNNSRLDVVQARYGEPAYKGMVFPTGKVALHFVPHVATSELFDEALHMALERKEAASGGLPDCKHYLFLHCNWDNPMAAEKEATLNLSKEDAEILLDHFDVIVLGHVHQPLDTMNGRVVVLGNTHPTGFGDLGTKRIMLIDPDTGLHSFETIYDAEVFDAAVDINDWLDGQAVVRPGTRFLTIVGELPAERAGDLSKAVSELWKTLPNLMALRSVVELQSDAIAARGDAVVSFRRLPEFIEKELQGRPRLLSLWKEVTHA